MLWNNTSPLPDNPALWTVGRKEFHFGFTPKKLSDQQKATEKKAKEGKLSLRGVLAHLNG